MYQNRFIFKNIAEAGITVQYIVSVQVFFMNGALIILIICGKLQSHLIQTN